jgi:D-sedoheptulose 7-phosphate isomerase
LTGMDTPENGIEKGYRERESVVRSFFRARAPDIAELCHQMARRFIRGGRLIAFGMGAAATDAQHVSVEFVHPVIVGKRALPAIALVNDVASTTAFVADDTTDVYARHLEIVGRQADIALGMIHGDHDAGRNEVEVALKQGASRHMLTLGLSGPDRLAAADYAFDVPSDDPFIVQEVHETLYHILWELVHVFFEHKGLLDDDSGSRRDTGRSSFLYPFLTQEESSLDSVLKEVQRSIIQKAEDVVELRRSSMDPPGVMQTGRLMRERVSAGGKVLAFGNGGSATDAQDLVVDLLAPPRGLHRIPAISLTNDAAVVTAVGNDVGFDNVFARQIIAYAKDDDIAVAFSTSGGSRNVIAALEEARRRGLLTIGLAGYGGGRLREICDRCHVIDGDYIPRIQEAQASQYHSLRLVIG